METLNAPRKTLKRLNGWRRVAASNEGFADCALIVPTYRRTKELIRLLNALAALPDIPGEVLVVDGSPEPELEHSLLAWASMLALRFDLVWIKSPKGLTRQRNVGLDACEREYVFFLDDDSLPEPGYFNAIRQVFVDDTAVQIGAVRGFLTNGINTPVTPLWRLRTWLGLAPRGEPGRYHASGFSGTWNMVPPFEGSREVEVLSGCAFALRREVSLKHRFSEYFHGYAQGEDLEMSRRIAKDWKLMICGDARVNHAEAKGGRPAGLARGRMAARNHYFIWKRHSPEAGWKDRMRFWGNHALIVVYHSLAYLRRPTHVFPLAYATGTFCGALECIFSPPRYEEPPAQREYEFSFG